MVDGGEVHNLLIFGASARAAAFSALRAGLRPWCADLFADADLRGRCPAMRLPGRYPLDFLRLIATEVPGPWMYTGALENHPFLVSQMSDRRELWGNGPAALLAVRNPYALGEVCRRLNLPAPATVPGPRPVSGGRWLVKPIAGAGGMGVRFWSPDGPAVPGDCVLQEYVEGVPAAAVYVAARRQARLLGLTRQLVGEEWLGAEGFRYCGSVGPIEPSGVLRNRLERLGQALASLANLVGLFGVDGVICGDAFWPVEVNPRYTASVEVLEYATGLEAMRLHREACGPPHASPSPARGAKPPLPHEGGAKPPHPPRPLPHEGGGGACNPDNRARTAGAGPDTRFTPPPPAGPPSPLVGEGAGGVGGFGPPLVGEAGDQPPGGRALGVSGKAIVYARRPGVFPADGPWRDAANRPVTALPDFADIPDPASPLDAGHPVLTVFARGADELSCVAELRRRAAEVQRLLENHHDAQRTG